MQKKQRNQYTRYDYALLMVTVFVALFGVLMIYSAGVYVASIRQSPFRFVSQQLLGLGIGFALMIFVSRFDYRFLVKKVLWGRLNFCHLAYLSAIIMQFVVLFAGVEKNGAKRWLNLGFIQFQPSELSKIAAILFVAYLIQANRGALDYFLGFLGIMLWMSVPIGLILVENMSSAIIVTGIVVGMCFVASKKSGYFFLCLAVLVLAGIAFIFLGEGFRAERIDIWLHVETNENAHQIKQGLYAICSGGVFGKGLGHSMQKLGYIPEAYNDMIFAVICEELGIFGALLVMLLFMVMFQRMVVIACNAKDLFGMMICVGVLIQFAIQVVINVAVVTNSIPSTGIPLPFISYGGTSAMIMMAELGLVLGVSRHTKRI